MTSEDVIVFLNVKGNTVSCVRGDGSDVKTLFTAECACPDGLGIDLNAYKTSKKVEDIVVWWSNMGAMEIREGEKDGGDWHAADGFLVRAPLFGGDTAVERVEVKAPRRLVRGAAAYTQPVSRPLITTMKQMGLSGDGRAVFFCDREGHGVKKYNVDTKEVVPLLSSDALAAVAAGITEEEEALALPVAPNNDEDKRRFCVGIALDEQHNQIFFTLKGPSKGGQGHILAAPYDFSRRNLPSSTAAETRDSEGVIDPASVVTLLDNLPEPIDLLLDVEEGFLYWTDRGDDAAGGNSLNRAALTFEAQSGRPQLGEKEVLLTGFNEAIGLSWAAGLEGRLRLPDESKDTLRRYMYVTDLGHLWCCDLHERTKKVVYTCAPQEMLTGVEVIRLD